MEHKGLGYMTSYLDCSYLDSNIEPKGINDASFALTITKFQYPNIITYKNNKSIISQHRS